MTTLRMQSWIILDAETNLPDVKASRKAVDEAEAYAIKGLNLQPNEWLWGYRWYDGDVCYRGWVKAVTSINP